MNEHDDSRPLSQPEPGDPGLLPVPEPLVTAEPAPFAPVHPVSAQSETRLDDGVEPVLRPAAEPSWRHILTTQAAAPDDQLPLHDGAQEDRRPAMDPAGGAAEPAGAGYAPARDTTI